MYNNNNSKATYTTYSKHTDYNYDFFSLKKKYTKK